MALYHPFIFQDYTIRSGGVAHGHTDRERADHAIFTITIVGQPSNPELREVTTEICAGLSQALVLEGVTPGQVRVIIAAPPQGSWRPARPYELERELEAALRDLNPPLCEDTQRITVSIAVI